MGYAVDAVSMSNHRLACLEAKANQVNASRDTSTSFQQGTQSIPQNAPQLSISTTGLNDHKALLRPAQDAFQRCGPLSLDATGQAGLRLAGRAPLPFLASFEAPRSRRRVDKPSFCSSSSFSVVAGARRGD